LATIASPAAIADDTSCKTVFDANSRLVKTPNHQFLIQSSDSPGSTPQAGEMIFTGKTTSCTTESGRPARSRRRRR